MQFLKSKQIAHQMGVSSGTVFNWMVHGINYKGKCEKLQFLRIGGHRKTSQEWLDDFLARINSDRPPISETPAKQANRVNSATKAALSKLGG